MAETDLTALLKGISPTLQDPVYVFVTLLPGQRLPLQITQQDCVMWFRETEGETLIVDQSAAQAAHLEGIFPCRMITLTIHSSLEAVGFMAAISRALAAHNIGVNPVAAYCHDHLFVAEDDAERAMEILIDLAKN